MVTALPISLPKALRVRDELFLQFVQPKPERRLERSAALDLYNQNNEGKALT